MFRNSQPFSVAYSFKPAKSDFRGIIFHPMYPTENDEISIRNTVFRCFESVR